MGSNRRCWYLEPKKQAHEAIFDDLAYIATQQSTQRDDVVSYLEHYAAGNVSGLGTQYATSRYFFARDDDEGHPEVRFNLACAMVDTAISLFAQAPTVPQYQSTDADFKTIRRAQKSSEVLQTQIDRKVQETIKRAALDAAKVGTGFVFERYDPITGLPGAERVHMLETHVEHYDGMYLNPRKMTRTRYVPKETLKAQYPRFATLIDMASGVSRTTHNDVLLAGMAGFQHDDLITVAESWYLRPNGASAGRHVICIESATLLDEKWERDSFPCAVFRYRVRDTGFYGSGLVESCLPAQARINKLIAADARAIDLGSNIVILNPNGPGAVSKETFTNDIGLIINYEPSLGAAPTLAKWEGGLDDVQQRVEMEWQRALMVEGISAEQTNGQGAGKGLDSGVAVRAADDVQSRRLVPYTSRFQDSCQDVAGLFEAMNDFLAETKPGLKIVSSGKSGSLTANFLKTSRWKDIRPPKGDARLVMSQMSALPTTPQGRWAAVQEWIQAGFVSRQYSMALLQFPDLDAYASTELAHLDFARWQIEQILDDVDPLPDPRQDLELAIDLAVKSKLKAATMNADEETLERFERFIVYCEELLDMAAAEEAAMAAPPPGAMLPPGAPPPPAPGLDPALLIGQVAAPALGGAPPAM